MRRFRACASGRNDSSVLLREFLTRNMDFRVRTISLARCAIPRSASMNCQGESSLAAQIQALVAALRIRHLEKRPNLWSQALFWNRASHARRIGQQRRITGIHLTSSSSKDASCCSKDTVFFWEMIQYLLSGTSVVLRSRYWQD